MANISDAAGSIHVTGTPTQVKNWIILQQQLNGNDYGFFPVDTEEFITEYKKAKKSGDKIIDIWGLGHGTGRWTLDSTNQNYFDFLWYEIDKNYHPTNIKLTDEFRNNFTQEQLIKKFKTLIDNRFYLQFDYTDFEPGCDVFYSAEDTITVEMDDGLELDDLKTTEEYTKEIKAQFNDFDALSKPEQAEALKSVRDYQPIQTSCASGEVINLEVSAAALINAGLADEETTFELSEDEDYGLPSAIETIYSGDIASDSDRFENLFKDVLTELESNNKHNLKPEDVLEFMYNHRIEFSNKVAEAFDNRTYIMYDIFDVFDELNSEPSYIVDAINEIEVTD